MATKTKLEQAVEKQAKNLGDAQRELLMSQFDTYLWNKRRISEIENTINLTMLSKKPLDPKDRKTLMTERHQLTVDNVSISTKLFMQLKNTEESEDEFQQFMRG